MALFLSCFLLNLLNFMNISNCRKRCPFLVCKLQQDIFIFLSAYFFSCFEFHVYLCSKKCLCFYLFFSDVFLLFFYSTNIANSIKRCFARNVLVFTSFLSLCFFLLLNSMNISNCCVSSKFPVLNLRWGIFPQLSNLLQNLDICIFNAIVFVFLSWDYLYVLELPSFFCNLFSISIFK